MKRVRQCSQCSSVNLEKISENEYRCKYCGSVQYGPASGVPRRLGIPRPGARGIAIIIAVIAITAGAGAWILLRKPVSAPEPASSRGAGSGFDDASRSGGRGPGEEDPGAEPAAEFTGVAEVHDRIGNVYFIGLYRNTGTVAIHQPSVTIILYDRNGRKAASARGYSIRGELGPGEETPVRVLVMDPPEYARYEALHEPMRPYSFARYRRPEMRFRGIELRKRRYSGYEVVGEILNAGDAAVEYVHMIATLMDGKGGIIGFGTAYLPEQRLEGGDYGPFRINVVTLAGVPRSYRLDYEARFARK